MNRGLELGRRDFLRALGIGATGAVVASPTELFSQSAQGGSDLAQKVLGAYEGLQSAGTLPSYEISAYGASMQLDPATRILISRSSTERSSNRYVIRVRRHLVDKEQVASKQGYDRDITRDFQMNVKEENGILSVDSVIENYFDTAREVKKKEYPDQSSSMGIFQTKTNDGLELIDLSSNREPILLPNASIPSVYTKLANAVYQSLQTQSQRKK